MRKPFVISHKYNNPITAKINNDITKINKDMENVSLN
jgi:hypothetical protein